MQHKYDIPIRNIKILLTATSYNLQRFKNYISVSDNMVNSRSITTNACQFYPVGHVKNSDNCSGIQFRYTNLIFDSLCLKKLEQNPFCTNAS